MFIPIKVFIRCIVCWCCWQASMALAWNSSGHYVIAAIALEDLTPSTQKAITALLRSVQTDYPRMKDLMDAAIWADEIRGDDIHIADHWHHINTPYLQSPDFHPKPLQQENIVWAVQQSRGILQSSRVPSSIKAWFLLLYVHFIGDIHQPLHCIEYYSNAFPEGDLGGNRYPVVSHVGHNLHEVWDRGVGYFQPRMKKKRSIQMAKRIRKTYPRQYFSNLLLNHPYPKAWAVESYELGKAVAYQTPPGAVLTPLYSQQSQKVVMQQVALAGYRLADQLNAIFDFQG